MEAPTIGNMKEGVFIHHYNLNNLNYEIELSTNNSNLHIKVTNKTNIENSFYIYEDSIENICKLDRYFMVFENIEDIKININEILKEKECFELKKEKENLLKLLIKASVGKQTKNIEFPLTKKEINNDYLINILIDKINSLEKENNILKNKFKEYEELFEEEIKQKKIIKENIIGDSITTLNKYEDYILIKNGIINQLKIENKNIKLKLIFKCSRDGWTSNDFHKYCDGKGPTISIIETKNNTLFGGFLFIKWKNEGGDTNDNKSFLFSFNNKKIYPNNGKNCAVHFGIDRGPYFAFSINIFSDFKKTNKNFTRNLDSLKNSWNNFSCNYELNNNQEYFDIKEIEVFEVLIEN